MKTPAVATLMLAGLVAVAAPPRGGELARLVIVPFDNVTGRKAQDPLQEGIADLLTVCFAALADRVAVVDRSLLRQLTDEQRLSQANLVATDTWQRIGHLAGATHLLGGSFGRSPKGLNVQGYCTMWAALLLSSLSNSAAASMTLARFFVTVSQRRS